jgi:hypothetical protein
VKKEQLLDLTSRVSMLTNIDAPVIVGSHSVFAVTDRVPAIVSQSIEADFMLAAGGIKAITRVNDELGVTSDFYDTYGYYADGLGLATVVLVPGWQDRLQPLTNESGQMVAQCLELHDAAVSKLMAGRDKDFGFIITLLDRDLISLPTLVERAALIQDTPSAGALRPRLKALLNRLSEFRNEEELNTLLELINRLS